jgi:hypothetical protein
MQYMAPEIVWRFQTGAPKQQVLYDTHARLVAYVCVTKSGPALVILFICRRARNLGDWSSNLFGKED